MTQINPYNPLDLEALGGSLIRELQRRPVEPLDAVESFPGAGIYALYYVGEQHPYAELGEFNRKLGCRVPIYVGRAKDAGARQGSTPFDDVSAPMLFQRIREHRRSIAEVERHAGGLAPLRLQDFTVRAIVCMPIWVPLAEAVAIRNDAPVWNQALPGFGIHAPGSGRGLQRRSQWDQLHPGRRFAMSLQDNERSAEALAAATHAACLSALERAAAALALTPSLAGSPAAPGKHGST